MVDQHDCPSPEQKVFKKLDVISTSVKSQRPGGEDAVVPQVLLVTHLAVFAVLHILLPVQEPVWDFVLARILHDGHHALNLEGKNTGT